MPEVQVIGSDGRPVGVMSSFQALEMARDQGLDLVEISPNSQPPTCKIMDYGKWKFQTKKKQKQARKNQAKIVVKEIQLRPRTNEGDVNIKLTKAREFLTAGCKVKVNLRFVGREMAHKEVGFKILKNVEKTLEDFAVVETPAKMERRTLFAIFAPIPTGSKKKKPQPADPARPKGLAEKTAPQVTVIKKPSSPSAVAPDSSNETTPPPSAVVDPSPEKPETAPPAPESSRPSNSAQSAPVKPGKT